MWVPNRIQHLNKDNTKTPCMPKKLIKNITTPTKRYSDTKPKGVNNKHADRDKKSFKANRSFSRLVENPLAWKQASRKTTAKKINLRQKSPSSARTKLSAVWWWFSLDRDERTRCEPVCRANARARRSRHSERRSMEICARWFPVGILRRRRALESSKDAAKSLRHLWWKILNLIA